MCSFKLKVYGHYYGYLKSAIISVNLHYTHRCIGYWCAPLYHFEV